MPRVLLSMATAVLFALSGPAHAIEALAFEVLDKQGQIEIRRYAKHLLATVRVSGDFADVGSRAFRPLFNYISGDNRSEEKIAMTAPVLQQPTDRANQWLVSFVMPSEFDQNSLPIPASELVRVSAQPAMLMAAIEYRGGWSQDRYRENETYLLDAVTGLSLQVCGEPRWARHDPPFMPWFMRKNEVLVPLCSITGQ